MPNMLNMIPILQMNKLRFWYSSPWKVLQIVRAEPSLECRLCTQASVFFPLLHTQRFGIQDLPEDHDLFLFWQILSLLPDDTLSN